MIFHRFLVVNFIKKFKTVVKKFESNVIAFDKHSPELFFELYFHNNKNLFSTFQNHQFANFTHFSTKSAAFQKSF